MHDVNITRHIFLNNAERTAYALKRLRALKVKQKVKQAVDSDIKMAKLNFDKRRLKNALRLLTSWRP